jgi:hypothetical protein
MKKVTTAACALALGLAWTAAPAFAQAKAEDRADQIEKKAEQKADQIEEKADRQADQIRKEGDRRADQVRGKTEDRSESVGDKMDRVWDKTKAKAREATDSVTGRDTGRMNDDVRSAQMALKDKGHDPGPIDGVMGPRTSAAIRDFQQAENLSTTGQLDAETRSKLMAGSSAPAASPHTTGPGAKQPKQP